MNKDILNKLQSVNEYPCVSILMPTHRSFPENQQDKIRLKNLVKDASKRLLEEFKKDEVSSIIKNLEGVIDEVDFNNSLDGLSVFINKEHKETILTPFPLKERILIDKFFSTKDIIFGINRTQPYWILSVSDKQAKLFKGVRDDLQEIKNDNFPLLNTYYPLKSQGNEEGEEIIPNVEREKMYLRHIDKTLGDINAEYEYPVVLLAVPQKAAIFKEVTTQTKLLPNVITGNYEHLSGTELSKIVWPEVKKSLSDIRQHVLDELEDAIGKNKYATGIDEVWKAANEGRGYKVLVELGFQYPAQLDETGLQLVPADVKTGEEIMDDAVDVILDKVIQTGGKVVFFKNNELTDFNKIAMILRY
ncbi:MAG: hypothetical protein ABI462_08965 [Ignavibacteria bacterium]